MAEHGVCKMAVIFLVPIKFIRPHMHHAAVREHGTAQFGILQHVFVKNLAHQVDRFRVGGVQHLAAALLMIHGPFINEIGPQARKGKGMPWRVELRNNIDAVLSGIADQVGKFLLGIKKILGCQGRSVLSLHFGFQAESRIAFLERIMAVVHIVFVENIVVVDDQVQVIHLVPGHGADHVLQVTEGVRRARDIKHEPAELVARKIHGRAAGRLAEHLQQGARAPEQAGGSRRTKADAVPGNLEPVSFPAQIAALQQGKGNIRLRPGGDKLDLLPQHVFHIRRKQFAQLLVRACYGDRIPQLIFSLSPLPLQDFRDNPRLGVALGGLRSLQHDFIILADGFLAVLGHLEADVDGGI